VLRHATRENSSLSIVGLKDLRHREWGVCDILTRIREMDRQLYSQTCLGMDSLQQWLPVFLHNPETWRAIVSSDGDLAAYWQTAVVDDDLYLGLKSGTSSESDLLARSYKDLSVRGTYNLYFVSICVNPSFRGLETSMTLIDSFFFVIDQLASKEVFFKEVTGSACSPDGEQICRTFRLDYLRSNAIGKLYAGSVGSVIDRFKGPLSARFPGLFLKYQRAGLI
jgi:hypothetical protein